VGLVVAFALPIRLSRAAEGILVVAELAAPIFQLNLIPYSS
jgi:hypothetical protein